MRNILIDADPGHDDIIGILVALANDEKLHILSITTVCGNATVENCTQNLLKVLDYLPVSLPVAQGYGSPLVRELENAAKYHGETGLDGLLDYPSAHSQPLKQHAVELIAQQLQQAQEPLTIVTLGPLTNIAMVLKTYPYLKEKIEEIVSMAGSFQSGNVVAKGEFNVFCDPESAKIVLDSGVPVVLATIEACYSGGILLTDQQKLKDGGRVSKLVYDILKYYSRYAIANGWDRTAIFDMTPIIYLLAPESFRYQDMKVYIETSNGYTRGMTVCDDRGPLYNQDDRCYTKVLLEGDRQKFTEYLFAAVETLDQRFQGENQ